MSWDENCPKMIKISWASIRHGKVPAQPPTNHKRFQKYANFSPVVLTHFFVTESLAKKL